MTIKQKVRLSNIMMVLIPIMFTTIIIIVCLNTSLGSYWHTFEDMYGDENGVQFAQSMIYSNLSEEDMEVARSVAGDAVDSAKTLTASRHEVSVIKDTFYYGDKAFSVTAVHRARTDQVVVSYLKNYIMKYLIGFVLFFVALTVCVNGVMSWWISKSILLPLHKLSCGTKEIREGSLDKALEYNKSDEFGLVCRDFEDMRTYLKESVEQRLADEQRRKDLIIGISHDLGTPLTSISGYLDGLIEGLADTEEKRER